jgi:predicted nucleic acid-binding protein
MLVVDTSVLIAHLRGAKRTTRFLEEHASRGPLLVPALAAWELWKGTSTPAQSERVEALLEAVHVDPFLPAMARAAGELHRRHRADGIERPTFDLLIASHALFHAAPLATLDRDYESIRGLTVIRAPA